MYLTRSITDLEGRTWEMAGIVPADCRMQTRLAGLGYRKASFCRDNILGKKGDTIRGHEFHYSTLTPLADAFSPAYSWQVGESFYYDGYTAQGILASYIHLHFLGNKQAAANFIAACKRFLKAYRRRNASCNY